MAAIPNRQTRFTPLRLALASMPWVIWMTACFLPAYKVEADFAVNGWDCFIFGFGAVIGFEEWPWVLAWLANVTMFVTTVAYLAAFNVRLQRAVAGTGAVLSLLVLRFQVNDTGTSSLLIAAFLWVAANLLLCYIVFRKND